MRFSLPDCRRRIQKITLPPIITRAGDHRHIRAVERNALQKRLEVAVPLGADAADYAVCRQPGVCRD